MIGNISFPPGVSVVSELKNIMSVYFCHFLALSLKKKDEKNDKVTALVIVSARHGRKAENATPCYRATKWPRGIKGDRLTHPTETNSNVSGIQMC